MLEANGLPMRHRGQGEPDCPQYDVPREVVYAPGACHFLRTELLRHVRWNEAIERTYFDDGDFCYRARALGEHIWYRPEATLVHHQGSFQRAAGEATIRAVFERNMRAFRKAWGGRVLPPVPSAFTDGTRGHGKG